MAATVKASKTAARRPARRDATPPPGPAAGPRVLRLTTKQADPVEREPIFYIDDVEYTIPVRMRTNEALECLHVFRTRGDEVATDFLLEKLLGADGYRALREYDGLEPEHLQQIIEIAVERMMGATEGPKAS